MNNEQFNSISVQQPLRSLPEQVSPRAGEQFLRFYLLPNTTGLLPLQQLTEVLTIPRDQIVPIFNMPPWVMGVYNWRGEILWMVDLGHLAGLIPWHQQAMSTSVYTAIVLQAGSAIAKATNPRSQTLGVVVNRVEDIEWCSPDWIQSPPSSTVTSEMMPFLRGYWLKPDGEMLVVLDGNAIVAAMSKQ